MAPASRSATYCVDVQDSADLDPAAPEGGGLIFWRVDNRNYFLALVYPNGTALRPISSPRGQDGGHYRLSGGAPLPHARLRRSPSRPATLRRLRLRCLQSCLSHSRPAAFGGIFLAIERHDMRGVSIEIWAPDPKLRLVCIDPLPQLFA